MLGIVDRIRAGVHQMLEDQLPGKTGPSASSRVALLPYVTSITNDLNTLGREGADLQPYIVAPPPPTAPQSQVALTQMADYATLQQLNSKLRSQSKQDHVATLAKRASTLLSEQMDTQFAGLNSRKKAKSGIPEQVINELLARPPTKLTVSRVHQPATERLFAILLEGDEMKIYLMLREISSVEFREDIPKAYAVASVSVLGKSERVLLGEGSGLRVFQGITEAAMLATQYFSIESFGDAALGRLIRWCEYYTSGSLFQTACTHCEKILADDSRYGAVPPTVRTFESGGAMHAICLQRIAASSSGPLAPYYQ